MIITNHAYARAGLVGNPSDGYFGKTIAFVIRNFKATVRLWETPHFEIVPTFGDFARFARESEQQRRPCGEGKGQLRRDGHLEERCRP